MTSRGRYWTGFLIAGAAGAACVAPVARAQSSVMLYGIADVFAGSVKNPGGRAAIVQQGGGMTTSFWGIGGTEDLGGGNKAFFALESYFQPQSGAYGRYAGDSLFSRNAYVGLQTRFGQLRFGRITTPLYLATIQFNPLFNSYTFSPMIFHTFKGVGAEGVVGDSAWNNAVAYTIPTFGGFNAGLLYALGNAAGRNGAKKWSVNANYTHGAFAAAAIFQYVNFSATPGDLGGALAAAPGLSSQRTVQVDASYDWRVVKLFAQYMNVANRAPSGNFHGDTLQAGVSVPIGVGLLLASCAYTHSSGAAADGEHRSTGALGYDYPLSKRTDIYAAIKVDRVGGLSTGVTSGAGLRTRF
ncbi:porin [Burkholderia oklahomensis]|uniref:porin n=1 Tax=Burkholderia oklahomensis TaxID=342113 RepID=UPI00016A8038|nr:porin [Burkholderia oklahomensis]AJX34944.1 gram-negative porin family protein [Burkholderia oklahomensis C6786]AOI49325.1 porin [Burkholderia oklahomensis C6786]KUY60628.1 porin [Burkholderia oklahomensis C6786]MBI0362423.1 porin [Burkholderia oklahomensis]SUY26532.1 Outer membrane porin protein 32 precursor [Burkholderia oklahomensis]